MALHLETFKTVFRGFFTAVEPRRTTFGVAGTKWAELYAGYAANAQAGANEPITRPTSASVDAAKITLASDLAGAFSSVTNADDLAAGMAAAFATFWPAVSFEAKTAAGALLATGTVTSPVSHRSLQDALTHLFSTFDPKANPPATAEDQADLMASLLDAWTQTVTVVNTIDGQSQPAVKLH